MGVWFAVPPLERGEQMRQQMSANSFRGRRSIGGLVTVTDRRVLFTPHRLDVLTGGRGRAVRLESVVSVTVLAPGREAVKERGLAAWLRSQVQIDDGTTTPLVVTVADPEALAATLDRGRSLHTNRPIRDRSAIPGRPRTLCGRCRKPARRRGHCVLSLFASLVPLTVKDGTQCS